MTGTALGVLATALEKLVALGVALYLPRHHLGVDDYGRYTFVLAHLNLFQVLPDIALDAVVVARLAAAGDAAPRLAGRAAALRAVVSLLMGALGIAVLPVVSDDPIVRSGALAWCGALLATAANPYRPLLRAQLRMGRYAALIAGQSLVAVALFVVALAMAAGVPAILLAIGAGNVCGLVLGRLLAGPGAGWRIDTTFARLLVSEARPLAVTTLLLMGSHQLLQAQLLRGHGPAAMGLFGGAQKLVEALNVLAQAVMVTALPALAVAAADSLGRAEEGARRTVRLLVSALVPCVVGLVLWPEACLGLLFGERLVGAAPVVRVLAWTVLLNATGSVVTSLLVATSRQRALVLATVASAAVTVLAGAVWTSRTGPAGVALGILAGMVAGQVTLLVWPETARTTRIVLGAAAWPVAVALVVVGLLGGWR